VHARIVSEFEVKCVCNFKRAVVNVVGYLEICVWCESTRTPEKQADDIRYSVDYIKQVYYLLAGKFKS
jgi:hypothetical protein